MFRFSYPIDLFLSDFGMFGAGKWFRKGFIVFSNKKNKI
jgi:nicotinamide mononucleotide (NMN) deamidase PncC